MESKAPQPEQPEAAPGDENKAAAVTDNGGEAIAGMEQVELADGELAQVVIEDMEEEEEEENEVDAFENYFSKKTQ